MQDKISVTDIINVRTKISKMYHEKISSEENIKALKCIVDDAEAMQNYNPEAYNKRKAQLLEIIESMFYQVETTDEDDKEFPNFKMRRKQRQEVLKILKQDLKQFEKVVSQRKKLSTVERTELAYAIIMTTDTYNALTAETNEERRALYKKLGTIPALMSTHAHAVFEVQIGPEEVAQVSISFYDNITNNDKNFKKYSRMKNPEERTAFIMQNIFIDKILVCDAACPQPKTVEEFQAHPVYCYETTYLKDLLEGKVDK